MNFSSVFIRLGRVGLLAALLTGTAAPFLAGNAQAQEAQDCFMVNSRGQRMSLNDLCEKTEVEEGQTAIEFLLGGNWASGSGGGTTVSTEASTYDEYSEAYDAYYDAVDEYYGEYFDSMTDLSRTLNSIYSRY